MASLYSPTSQDKVWIEEPGVYQASDLKWTPQQRFVVKVYPGFILELEMKDTQWIARYHGSTTVEIDTRDFEPDRFTLKVRPFGIRNFYDVHPNQLQQQLMEKDDLVSKLNRVFLVEENQSDMEKLNEWHSSRKF